jgi:hypothetical protein
MKAEGVAFRIGRARMAKVRRLDALLHIEDGAIRAMFGIEDFSES